MNNIVEASRCFPMHKSDLFNMDVLKLPISQGSTKHNLDVKQGDTLTNGLVNYPILNVEALSNTPKKRTKIKSPNMEPVTNQTDLALITPGSPLAQLKPEGKTRVSLKTNRHSPKASPQRKRKRYLSNPGDATTNASSRNINQGDVVTQARSPSTSIKRKRRRSASLSISDTKNSPKENKNQENLPTNTKPKSNISLNIDKQTCSPQRKLVRTPSKHIPTKIGTTNNEGTNSKLHITSCNSPPEDNPGAGPPNTTVWGWSPIRGKFKPKSVEYQNGQLVENSEIDENQLATSFKSKWQSVSFQNCLISILVKIKNIFAITNVK